MFTFFVVVLVAVLVGYSAGYAVGAFLAYRDGVLDKKDGIGCRNVQYAAFVDYYNLGRNSKSDLR